MIGRCETAVVVGYSKCPEFLKVFTSCSGDMNGMGTESDRHEAKNKTILLTTVVRYRAS